MLDYLFKHVNMSIIPLQYHKNMTLGLDYDMESTTWDVDSWIADNATPRRVEWVGLGSLGLSGFKYRMTWVSVWNNTRRSHGLKLGLKVRFYGFKILGCGLQTTGCCAVGDYTILQFAV